MPQQPRPVALDGDAAEPLAVDAVPPVVPGEPLVHERVVGVEQLHDAAVAENLALEEQRRLALHVGAQVLVELEEDVGVGNDPAHPAELQPLAGEVADEGVRPGVGEHARDLAVELVGVGEPAGLGRREERLVGDVAPQEQRQSSRQLQVGQPVRGPRGRVDRIALDAEQELGGHQ